MSKLPKEHKFIDLSDYGRPIAKIIANYLKNTVLTPIHVTIGFIIAGFLAVYCMLENLYWYAAFFRTISSIKKSTKIGAFTVVALHPGTQTQNIHDAFYLGLRLQLLLSQPSVLNCSPKQTSQLSYEQLLDSSPERSRRSVR